MSESTNKSATIRTRRAIINLLKQEGPMDSLALASRLTITAMAVRQHLYVLQKERLLDPYLYTGSLSVSL